MTQVVALTGGIGCGKTEATRVFVSLGVPVVDLDVIAHAMSQPGSPAMQQIQQVFGSDFFEATGQFDRAKMRALVFSDEDALAKLNAIMHPAIHAQATEQIKQYANSPYMVLAIPLLVESEHYWPLINHVLVIDCDESTQIERVMQRSAMGREQVEAILAAQSSRQERLDIADTVIKNDGKLENLLNSIKEFHKSQLSACIQSKSIS